MNLILLEGEVFQIGGKDETIQIYLEDGERTHICTTSREKGREIAAQYLFKGKVRYTVKDDRREPRMNGGN